MTHRLLPSLFSLSALLGLVSCSTTPQPLATVENFQPSKYAGEWHEIARLPAFFQKDLVAARATYGVNPDGSIMVRNDGLKGDGEKSFITGTATPVGDVSDGKLKVRFDRFPASLFAGDYWVLDVDADYEMAVVGTPTRKFLWLLSKDPQTTVDDFQPQIKAMAAKGFPTENLIANSRRYGGCTTCNAALYQDGKISKAALPPCDCEQDL